MTSGPDDKNLPQEELEAEDPSFLEVEGDEDGDSEVEEVVPGLRGASELDSIQEEMQKHANVDLETEAEVPQQKSARQGGGDRGQRDFTAAELLKDELRIRAERDQGRIRPYLTGKIIIFLEDTKKRYIFDWTTETLRTGSTDETEGDCVIWLSEDNLMRIANGALNPQVGMLSDKIRVTGKLGLAIYIFNLIAPRHFLH